MTADPSFSDAAGRTFDFDPLGDIDMYRAIRDVLFDGLVAVDRGERLRVIDADASAAIIWDALHPASTARATPGRSAPSRKTSP